MKKLWTLILISNSTLLFASELSFDIGNTKTIFNRLSIPNENANRITLPTDKSLTSYRVTGFFDIGQNNQLYVLIAPLELSYNFRSRNNFEFNDTTFNANESSTLDYKFNSYRLGYLWKWKANSLSYWAGFTGKIRDARTKLTQNGLSDEFSNIGFVPLASLGLDWRFLSNLSFYTHADALGASQGSAYDIQFELKYRASNLAISIGHRLLGGGADNDRVFNFAQFDTSYLRASYLFGED